VIARYANRPPAVIGGPAKQQSDLLWRALRLGTLCAACAFAFFFVSERNLFHRTGQALGPLPDSIQRVQLNIPSAAEGATLPTTDAETFLPAAPARHFALPDDKNLKVTEFDLRVNPEFQDLEGIELRVASVNPATNSYDITVRTKDREFYRQDVKLQEHVPLTRNAGSGPQLVVGEITENRVYGYLTEPLRRGHRRHRRHA
jgi:hypothetical protein